MCLAIYKPKGVQIKKKFLRNGFDANEDGAGFAYVENGSVHICKGFFTFDNFWAEYKKHSAKQALIHFRWATHGAATFANCHPFSMCDGKFALIHNGILDIECTDKSFSDTWHFSELVMSPLLDYTPLDSPALQFVIESTIGDGNKLCVLRGDGAFKIFNESAGHWKHGAWFSNEGYKRESAHNWRAWGSGATGEDVPKWWPKDYKSGDAADFEKFGLTQEDIDAADLSETELEELRAEIAEAQAESGRESFPDYEPSRGDYPCGREMTEDELGDAAFADAMRELDSDKRAARANPKPYVFDEDETPSPRKVATDAQFREGSD